MHVSILHDFIYLWLNLGPMGIEYLWVLNPFLRPDSLRIVYITNVFNP